MSLDAYIETRLEALKIEMASDLEDTLNSGLASMETAIRKDLIEVRERMLVVKLDVERQVNLLAQDVEKLRSANAEFIQSLGDAATRLDEEMAEIEKQEALPNPRVNMAPEDEEVIP